MKLTSTARLVSGGVDFRNLYMENNATPLVEGWLEPGQEVHPVTSAGSGTVRGYIDLTTFELSLAIEFSLPDTLPTQHYVTGAALWAGPAGVSGGTMISDLTLFPSPFPTGTTAISGNWSRSLGSNSPITLTSSQVNALCNTLPGGLYINLETNVFATGELRAQLSAMISIDGVNFYPWEKRNYQFEGVRSVAIANSGVHNIKLVEASVNLYSCRSDDAGVPNVVDVDASSSLVSYEHRNNFQVSENIFVNSISYDITGETSPSTPTSVWGPLRTVLMKKVYHSLPANVKYGSLLDGTSPIAFGTVSSTPVTGGVLGTRCAKLFIPASITASLDLGFSLVADKYYLWSIHALKDSPDISGNLGIPGDAQLGQVILKQAQWACSYGIKKFSFTTPPTDTVHLSIHNSAGTQGIIYLADVQVVEFDNLSDAISYAQSRAFITTRTEKILGPVHTSSSASAYFRWIAEEASFEIENAFNIAEIARIDVGVYNVLFEIALDELPVVQLTPETLEVGGEVDTAVVASFEELSVAGFTVRLVEIIDGVPTPVDDSFSLLVV